MQIDIAEETIEGFASFFGGRTDVWGSVEGRCNKEDVTLEHYRKHLAGETSLGIYPLLGNGTCRFFAIDLDEKDFEKAKAIRQEFYNLSIPVYIAQSKSKGYHIYGFCVEPIKAADIRRILHSVLDRLSIKAEVFPKQDEVSQLTPYGNYINLPCFGAARSFVAADEQPTPVPLPVALASFKPNIPDQVTKVLNSLPAPPPGVKPGQVTKKGRKKSKSPPCIEQILAGVDTPGRDEAAFALARYYLDRECLPEEALSLLTTWDTRNRPPIGDQRALETKIHSAQKGYGFGCTSIQENPLLKPFCCGVANCGWLKTKKKADDDKEYLARFPNLVDLVEDGGEVKYLTLTDDARPEVVSCVVVDAVRYYPPEKLFLPFALPKWEGVEQALTEPDTKLYSDLVQYFKEAAELPAEEHYRLMAWWGLHTYLYDRFNYSPVLAFVGVPERGKTRLGKAVIRVAYRGIETETLREPNLFRWSNDLGATIFLDVRDISRKAEREQSDDILLKRYEKGSKVARVLYPERGAFRDTVYYDIYGPTIIATNEPIHHILDTRCLPVVMPLAKRRIWDDLDPMKSLALKERLVAFRARHMHRDLPAYPKPALGRLGDILQPLGVVMRIVSPNEDEAFRKVTTSLLRERLLEKSTTMEARVIGALALVSSGGQVAVKDVTAAYNSGLSERQQVSPESIGRKLRALGFESGKTIPGKGRAIIANPELLASLQEQWGVECARPDSGEPSHP